MIPFVLVAVAAFLLDQLSKVVVSQNIQPGTSVPVIENVFHLTYLRNSGGAFGLFPNQPKVFLLSSLLVMAGILVYYAMNRSAPRALKIALGLALGGAAGNLVDRLSSGKVVDFLDFRIWPVFNLADSAIVIGLAFLVFQLFLPSPNRDLVDGQATN